MHSPLTGLLADHPAGSPLLFLDWELASPTETDWLARLGFPRTEAAHAESDLRFRKFPGGQAAAFWDKPFEKFRLEEVQRILGSLFAALNSGGMLAIRSPDFTELDEKATDARRSLLRQSGFHFRGVYAAPGADAIWVLARI